MKKLLALVLCVLFAMTAMLVTACEGEQTPAVTPPEGEGDIVRDADGNVVYDNVEIKMWSVTTGDDANTQDDIIARFNETYKGMIKVNVEHYSRYDLETLLSSTIQFDKEKAPDILFNHGSRTAEYFDRGWLREVDYFFGKSGATFDKPDFVPSLLESVVIDGKAYGMPIDCHSAIMCVRSDILEKNGLSMPTNYAELCAVCDQAAALAAANNLWIRGENSDGYKSDEWRKASTAQPYTAFPISFGDMWVHEFVGYSAMVQNGGEIVSSDGMPAWNSAATANGIQVLKNWIFPTATSQNKSAMSIDYGSSYDVGDAPFNKGECIFKLQGPWAWQKEKQTFDLLLSKDGGSANITTRSLTFMFATDTSKPYASKIKGEGHAITLLSTVTSYTKACAATVFMDYMANFSGIEWAKRGHLPAARSVSAANEYLSDPAYNEYVKYWGEPKDYVVVAPTKYYSYVDSYFKSAVQKSLAGSYKDRNVADILKSEYDDCIDYINLYA